MNTERVLIGDARILVNFNADKFGDGRNRIKNWKGLRIWDGEYRRNDKRPREF